MTRTRLTSLDAFRGATIAGMILVNNPGSWSHVYGPLRHAEWHGWTPTDLIFPFFLFIVGVAMTFSVEPRLTGPEARGPVVATVLRRAAIIVGLGLLMSAYPTFDFGAMRVPGVLQRIGAVFLVAALVVAYLRPRAQVMVTGGLLLGYWAVMALVPVPGYGAGDLSPDGNLAAHIDRAVFGSHMWRNTWDPEGLLSTIPAVATTLTGVFVGRWLQSDRSPSERTAGLFVYGWAAILVGLAWHPLFPINKSLWTSSYVLFTTGAAMQGLGVCYWLIDVNGRRRWALPAVVLGRNAIAVYVLSGLLAETLVVLRVSTPSGDTSVYGWIYQNIFVPLAGPMNGSLAFAIATVGVWFGAMWLLYRRNIFIKV